LLGAALRYKEAPRGVTPLYLRPLAMPLRPGIPRRIRASGDLLRPGPSTLVVNGAVQNGAWAATAGGKGNICTVKAWRANITG
jgi:accessory colonization factor AcfC